MPDEIAPLFSWRSALCDSDLGPTARGVAMFLSNYMSTRSSVAWPSVDTLAHDTGYNERTVRRAIDDLIATGWLTVTKRHNKSTIYEAKVPGTESALDRTLTTPGAGTESTEENKNSLVNSPTLPFGQDFDIAYAAYPKHEGRKAAHRAYVAQRRKGASAYELLLACKKMQIDCRGTDTKYIKLMATFLGPDDWWKEKLGNSDTDVESPATLCPTCGLDHRGAPCPFEAAAHEMAVQEGVSHG